MSAPTIQIYMLGRFEVVRGQKILTANDWSRHKAALLFQYLALEHRLIKDQVIEFLWPDNTPEFGANNLYQTLHLLRQTLENGLGRDSADHILLFEGGVLSLESDVWVDADEFQHRCANPQASIPDLEQALALYQGDLLPDNLYDEWTQPRREALQRLHRDVTLRLVDHYREAMNLQGAIALLMPLVARDRTDESAHRELMRLYALGGRRHEALRQYQRCVEALATELGVAPEPATDALYMRIAKGEFSAPVAQAVATAEPVTIGGEHLVPLVGRQSELAALNELLTQAQDRGRTILLTGDPGVGKTRLAYEVLRNAADAGLITLFGGTYELEGQLTYQPFIEAIDRYLIEHNRPLEANPITHFTPLGLSDPQQEQSALFRETAAFLVKLTQQRSVMLLVDDLHAADETSLRLFHYLARQTRSTSVILIATYRPDVVETLDSPCGTLLNALYRERLAETYTLTALPEIDVGQIMAYVLDGAISPDLLREVSDLTEGNPFFIQEIARALLKFGQIEKQAGQWTLKPGMNLRLPAGLMGLVRERVARLGPNVEPVLRTAAVIGRRFQFNILREVVPLPDDHVLDALDAALTGRLLEEVENGYLFRHPLIRQTLYEGLSRARRAHLHARTAEALEAAAPRPEEVQAQVEVLAYHYDSSDHRERAVPYLLQAGEKAARVFALEVALGYFERALQLVESLNVGDPALHWQILEQLGWWGVILADTPRAVDWFERALALPPQASWHPHAFDRARVHRAAARTLITAGNMAAAERHLRTALDQLDPDEQASGDYAYLLYDLALWHWHRNEFELALKVAQHSLEVAERLGEPTAIARAFEMLALAAHSLGDWQQGLDFEAQRSALTGPGLDVTEAFDVHL